MTMTTPKREQTIGRCNVGRWNDVSNNGLYSQSGEQGDERIGQIFNEVRRNLSQPATPTKSNPDMLRSTSLQMDDEIAMQPYVKQHFSTEEVSPCNGTRPNGNELSSDGKISPNDTNSLSSTSEAQSKSKASKMINFTLRHCFKVLQTVEELTEKLMANAAASNAAVDGTLVADLAEISVSLGASTATSPNWRPPSKIDQFLSKCTKLYMEIVYLVGLFEKTFYSLPKSQVDLMLELNRAIGELQWERNGEKIYGSTEERQMKLGRSLSDVSRNMEAFIVVLVQMKASNRAIFSEN